MQSLHAFVDWFNGIVWGVPMIVMILGTGLFLQLRLAFMPILKIGYGFKMIWAGRKKAGDAARVPAAIRADAQRPQCGGVVGRRNAA